MSREKLAEYGLFAAAAYQASNSSNTRTVNGWQAVNVPEFRASSAGFAAQLYTDGQGKLAAKHRASTAYPALMELAMRFPQ